MAKIFILGAGGFGTALAVATAPHNNDVILWSNDENQVSEIKSAGENVKLLKGIPVPSNIDITTDLGKAKNAELVIIAVPSNAVREVARRLKGKLSKDTVVACVAKGFEEGTLKRLSQVILEELPQNDCVIVSGPSHAEEIARNVPTTVVSASLSRVAAEKVQDILSNPYLRIYVNDDVTGVELGGALKNVIALAAGVSDGLKLGDNSKAALMTRGMIEIARLGVACGGKTETFAGLSGIGDLIVTCTSMHSRNRRAGILIGQGKKASEAIAEVGMVVEGYRAAKSAYELSQKQNVDMPIITEIYKVLYEDKSPENAIRDLMGRPKRHESEAIWLMNK